MKARKLIVAPINALIGLIILAAGLLLGIGPFVSVIPGSEGITSIPFPTIESLLEVITKSIPTIFSVFTFTGANAIYLQVWQFATWVFVGFYLILLIIFIITVCVNKKQSLLWYIIPSFVFAASIVYLLGLGFSMVNPRVEGEISGWIYILRYLGLEFNKYGATSKLSANWWISILVWLFLIGFVIYIISTFASLCTTLRYSYIHRFDKYYKKHPELLEEKNKTIINNIIEGNSSTTLPGKNNQAPLSNLASQNSPLIVQYFNNYGKLEDEKKNIASEEEKETPLTKEDVKRIIKEIIEEKESSTIETNKVETENDIKNENFSVDELRQIIKDEIKDAKAEMTLPKVSVSGSSLYEEKEKHIEERASSSKNENTPIIVAIPQSVPAYEEKENIEEETLDTIEDNISEEELRSLVSNEIHELLKDLQPKIPVEEIPQTEEIKEETLLQTNIQEIEVKEITEENIEETKNETKEEIKEIVEPFSAPIQEESPAIVVEDRGSEVKVEKGEIIRIPFKERLASSDPILHEHYNNLKGLLLSYGLKNRVSNGGDAFRLHKVTYCKITVAGKSLKLYLALNPKDYENSSIPVSDASSKAIYKEIPLVFKVKSSLSLKRARELISDTMDKAGLEQVTPEITKDYIAELSSEEEE